MDAPAPGPGVLLPGLAPETFDAEIGVLRARVRQATTWIVAIALPPAVGLAALGRREALLPLAFVLGWLNLAGL